MQKEIHAEAGGKQHRHNGREFPFVENKSQDDEDDGRRQGAKVNIQLSNSCKMITSSRVAPNQNDDNRGQNERNRDFSELHVSLPQIITILYKHILTASDCQCKRQGVGFSPPET